MSRTQPKDKNDTESKSIMNYGWLFNKPLVTIKGFSHNTDFLIKETQHWRK